MSNMHQLSEQSDVNVFQPPPNKSLLDLPDELINQILLRLSLPSLIQFIQSSKRLWHLARTNHRVLTLHLQEVPGDKSSIDSDTLSHPDKSSVNDKLFLLLRQRASKQLVGINFTANCHEHITRNAKLDPFASAIEGFDADYVSVSLAFRNQADIRQYSNHLRLKEKIETCFGSGWRIFKVVQWQRYVSALISRSRTNEAQSHSDAESRSDSSEDEDTDAPDIAERSVFTSRATCRATLNAHNSSAKQIEVRVTPVRQEYMLVHFDIYSTVAPHVDAVDAPRDSHGSHYVPKDLAILDDARWAILWDLEDTQTAPRPRLMYYTSLEHGCTSPVSKLLWPKPMKGKKILDSDDEDTALKKCKPRRIAFFKDGRRIKMFGAGDIVPRELVSVQTVREQYNPTNVLEYNNGRTFRVDTPFYGTHATKEDVVNGFKFCYTTHLCLGLTKLAVGEDGDKHVHMLCLLRSRNKTYVDSCDHTVSLQKMQHLSSSNTVVVGRLWGWEKWCTNLTGLETVAISKYGTRIAIAMWNKVLIYALNPRVLCEDIDDQEFSSSKKKKKVVQQAPDMPRDFYLRIPYGRLGRGIVDLKPVVLDLNGAIAHKMRWTAPRGVPSDDYRQQTVDGEKTDADDESTSTDGAEDNDAESSQSVTVVAGAETEPTEAQANVETAESEQLTATEGHAEASEVDTISSKTQSGQEATLTPEPNQETKDNAGTQNEATITKPESNDFPLQHSPQPPVQSPSGLQTAVVVGLPPTGSSGIKTTPRKKEKQAEVPLVEVGEATTHVTQHPSSEVSPFTAPKPETLGLAVATASNPQVKTPNNPNTISGSEPSTSDGLATTSNAKTEAATLKEELGESQPNTGSAQKTQTQCNESKGESKNESGSESEATHKSKARSGESQEAAMTASADKCKGGTADRAKRITEDELLILTDRGIQVWNVGARARGRRKRTNLELEESMNGKTAVR